MGVRRGGGGRDDGPGTRGEEAGFDDAFGHDGVVGGLEEVDDPGGER